MWAKAEQYLRKMGGLILVASIIIWALSYFPRYDYNDIPQDFKSEMLSEIKSRNIATDDAKLIENLTLAEYQQQNSLLGHIGKFVQPVMQPMQFGWKVCVSLLAGAAAKEVVVSTLGVLYVGDDDEAALSQRLRTPSPLTGSAPFTTASALAFLVFVLLYFPCIATITAIIRETGSWRYGLFSMIYNTTLAWILSFITYSLVMIL